MMRTKILCVDDDANILAAYQRSLRRQFAIETALSGDEGLAKLASEGPYAVVVADMNMPGMNGILFLTRVQTEWPDSVRIMLTGNADQATAMAAVNQGHVFQFLTKPCPPEIFARVLQLGIRQYQLVTAERELLEKTLNGSVQVLIEVLSMADPQSFGMGQALRNHMRAFTDSDGSNKTWELELAAMLCPIGSVTIPPSIHQKRRAGLLSDSEGEMFNRVAEIGASLLANIPRLELVSQIVLYQDKRFDGSGLPADGVAGEDIPAGARILKVLKDMVELESKGLSRDQALKQMGKRTGWYDPKVLDAACARFDIFLAEGETAYRVTSLVSASEVKVGQLLVCAVECLDGTLLVPAGTHVTPMVLERIKNFNDLVGIREPIRIEEPSGNRAAAA